MWLGFGYLEMIQTDKHLKLFHNDMLCTMCYKYITNFICHSYALEVGWRLKLHLFASEESCPFGIAASTSDFGGSPEKFSFSFLLPFSFKYIVQILALLTLE